ncbi:ATP-binding protein [Candidatus Azoamicus ciliaticola]|uniref:Electron transport complex subunit RsxB n=1 Tax=Candidatus Azoamicus ciliaticola TaxID=2652803 RepID=A0A6J5JYM2_9GAMM|nr:hypothetical protein [Candidatus Azoamicus ciliaticola]CAB3976443.1 Electron transport complex subunit RsxB [Candidatus Azoamicus ciliaticola]
MNYVFFINNRCVFCNNCLDCCPTHTIKKNINGYYLILDSGCVDCFKCFYICPVNAVEFYKVKSDLKINKYVFKDRLCIKKTLYNKNYTSYFRS